MTTTVKINGQTFSPTLRPLIERHLGMLMYANLELADTIERLRAEQAQAHEQKKPAAESGQAVDPD